MRSIVMAKTQNDLKGIKVCARVRPFCDTEILRNDTRILSILPPHHLYFKSTSSLIPEKTFIFEKVFGEDCSQEDLFEEIIPLLSEAFVGRHCSCFAYGQTGSGKSYTMLGADFRNIGSQLSHSPGKAVDSLDPDLIENFAMPCIGANWNEVGIVPRCLNWCLDRIAKEATNRYLMASYIEIYNDKVFDLLAPSRTPVKLREKTDGRLCAGIIREAVTNWRDAVELLFSGAKNRIMATTISNDCSSRSHAIVEILIVSGDAMDVSTGTNVVSKIRLVDLAGSEKWRSEEQLHLTTERRREFTEINKSLSALGNCVLALQKSPAGHVPYRDSSLTRYLRDSLQSKANVLFFVTVSPSRSCSSETLSTLKFADRAMRVQIFGSTNSITASDSLNYAHLHEELLRLRQLVKELVAFISKNRLTLPKALDEHISVLLGADCSSLLRLVPQDVLVDEVTVSTNKTEDSPRDIEILPESDVNLSGFGVETSIDVRNPRLSSSAEYLGMHQLLLGAQQGLAEFLKTFQRMIKATNRHLRNQRSPSPKKISHRTPKQTHVFKMNHNDNSGPEDLKRENETISDVVNNGAGEFVLPDEIGCSFPDSLLTSESLEMAVTSELFDRRHTKKDMNELFAAMEDFNLLEIVKEESNESVVLSPDSGKTPKKLWKECYDGASGTCYYRNRVTGETTWDKPSKAQLDLLCANG